MSSLARKLESAGMAIVAAASLAGCFSSRAPLVSASDSVKLFGDQGEATRLDFGPANAPVHIFFRWQGDSYSLIDPREPRGHALYRITPIRENWLLTQRMDHGVAVYGLARREGVRLWTYSPACQDLSDADRAGLDLTIQADGMCWLSTPEQLKGAMRKFAAHSLPPDGYFELMAH